MVLHCKKEQLQKTKEKKTSLFLRCDFVFFCQIGVVNRVFSIFFLSFKQMAFFSNKWHFLATNGFFQHCGNTARFRLRILSCAFCLLISFFNVFFQAPHFRIRLGGPLGVRFCFCYNLLWLTVLTEASEDKSLSVSDSVSVLFRPEVKWFNEFFSSWSRDIDLVRTTGVFSQETGEILRSPRLPIELAELRPSEGIPNCL